MQLLVAAGGDHGGTPTTDRRGCHAGREPRLCEEPTCSCPPATGRAGAGVHVTPGRAPGVWRSLRTVPAPTQPLGSSKLGLQIPWNRDRQAILCVLSEFLTIESASPIKWLSPVSLSLGGLGYMGAGADGEAALCSSLAPRDYGAPRAGQPAGILLPGCWGTVENKSCLSQRLPEESRIAPCPEGTPASRASTIP